MADSMLKFLLSTCTIQYLGVSHTVPEMTPPDVFLFLENTLKNRQGQLEGSESDLSAM